MQGRVFELCFDLHYYDLVEVIREKEQISIARVCRFIELDPSGYYYTSVHDDSPVDEKLREFAAKLPTRGCPDYASKSAGKE